MFFYFIVKFYLHSKMHQSQIWFIKANSVLTQTPYLKALNIYHVLFRSYQMEEHKKTILVYQVGIQLSQNLIC